MFPSMYASPGHRLQLPMWVHWEQLGKSRAVIERTSFNWSEWRQISRNGVRRTFPLGSGN